MMIKSNVGQVVGRLRRLDAEMPAALSRAVSPTYWKPRFESVALRTLRAQWALERNLALRELYERLTPRIVATMVGETFEGGTLFGLSIPRELVQPSVNLAGAAEFNLGQRTPTGRIKKEVVDAGVFHPETLDQAGGENLERARQIVRDWVMLEKQLGPEDYQKDGSPLSPEQLAQRIEVILGIGRSVVPRERTQAMQDAAASLARAIQRWLDGEGDTPSPNYSAAGAPPWRTESGPTLAAPRQPALSAEVAEQWLSAVLAAWKAYILASLPARMRMELARTMKRIQTEMI
jgi:hypothetical protein